MAVSNIPNGVVSYYFSTNTVKEWFDPSLIDTSNITSTIEIMNNIAFVRIDHLKIRQPMSNSTMIIDGRMPKATQACYARAHNLNFTKSFIMRVFPNDGNLSLTTAGYNANDELDPITFSYPI